jgi:hypothetical protein
MTSSCVLSVICGLKDQVEQGQFINQNDSRTSLYEYTSGLDRHRRKIYINAEIRPNSLDKGKSVANIQSYNIILGSAPTEEARQKALQDGISGDQPAQFIGQQLGGDGCMRNVFPLNEQVPSYRTHAK